RSSELQSRSPEGIGKGGDGGDNATARGLFGEAGKIRQPGVHGAPLHFVDNQGDAAPRFQTSDHGITPVIYDVIVVIAPAAEKNLAPLATPPLGKPGSVPIN